MQWQTKLAFTRINHKQAYQLHVVDTLTEI